MIPPRGWFLLHRGWMGSADFKPEPFTEREAYLWSIEQAAHSPHDQWFNGAQFTVDRGEFVTSSRKLAVAFGWGEKRTRGFMQRMSRCQKWTLQTAQEGAHSPTILTVCNYAHFQTPVNAKDAANDADDGAARAQRGRSEGAQQKEGLKKGNEGGRKEIALRADPLPFQAAIDAWSQGASLKGWKPAKPSLNDERRRTLGKTLKDHGLDGFVAAIQRALDSELLGGPDPPAWFNFSFVCKTGNILKILEGNYDQPFSNSQPSRNRSAAWLSAHSALAG